MQYAAPVLWLTSKCLDTISREIQLYLPLRTGGTLLGQGVHTRSKDITHAITAGPHAMRTKEAFRTDDAYQAEQINALLTQEASDTQYIGDWFYDPDATNFSDSTYLKTMKERAHSGSEPFVCNNPVLLLVTYKDDQLKFYGFQYSHSEAIAPSPAPGWPFETQFEAYDSMDYHEVRIYGRR